MKKMILGSFFLFIWIAALGFCLCLGLTLSILACALPNNWWPMFQVIFIILLPFPLLFGIAITGRGAPANDVFFKQQTQNTFFLELGVFLSVFLFISGFLLPVVLAHAGVIDLTSLVLNICGGIIMYASIAGYGFFYIFKKKKQPEML